MLASVVIVAAAGVGVGLGQLAQRDSGSETAFGSPPAAEAPRLSDSGLATAAPVVSSPSTSAEVTPSVVREPEVAEETEASAASSASAAPPAQTAPKKRTVESAVTRAPAKPAKVEPPPDPTSDPFLRRR